MRPAPPLTVQRQSAIRRGQPILGVKSILNAWRKELHIRDFPGALFSPSGILKDETIELLAGVGNIRTKARLEQVLAGQWTWYERYGDALLAVLQPLDIAKIPKKSTRSAMVKKRAAPAQPTMPGSTGNDEHMDLLHSKRARVSSRTGPVAGESTPTTASLLTPETRVAQYPTMTYRVPMTPSTYTPVPALTMPMVPFPTPTHTTASQPVTPAFASGSANWAPYYTQPQPTPVNTEGVSYSQFSFDTGPFYPYYSQRR